MVLGKFFGSIANQSRKLSTVIPSAPAQAPKLPNWVRLPSFKGFNFLLLHYLYMLFMTILGSIILYPGGGVPYIDALFFSAGAATQSGLNTIDVNLLKTYQQVTLVLLACLCNPIIINGFVVFVRLYWFEKRFQGVVTQARHTRGRTMSRMKSEERRDLENNDEGLGVGDREIAVLLDAQQPRDGGGKQDIAGQESEKSSSDSHEGELSGNGHEEKQAADESSQYPAFHRNIMFADEITAPQEKIPNEERMPEQRTKEQHIAFVENQRNPKDNTALYIPGPRDVERGIGPQRIEEGDSSSDADRDSVEIRKRLGAPATPNVEWVLDEHPTKRDEPTKRQWLKQGLHGTRNNSEMNDSPSGLRSRIGTRTRSIGRGLSRDKTDVHDPLPYLSYAATIGRNSTFVDLTEEQREELGGIEYRALKTLAWVLITYYLGYFLVGFIIMVPWITKTRFKSIPLGIGQSPTWWGFFTTMSMFTDLGFTLTPDSMNSFNQAVPPLLVGTILIIAGNTGFPCFLRFSIWLASKCVPYGSGVWEELQFLLDHPRRCFTLLFPKKATWWLFAVLVLLNAIDLIFFVILDLHDSAVTSLPPAFQFLDGLFQAASTRTAGFSCVNLAALHPGIQVSYLVMMYISVFPIAISVRNTNVYEEKSLGVYATADDDDPSADPNSTSYIGSHLRRQLSFDLWYVFLGVFLITIVEGRRIENVNEPAFTTFSVLFEVVSAYGTVGLSLGFPTINASFSAEFHVLSKLIIIAMMLRGRHRGLPYALDRAILLPSESLQRKEQAMAEARRERRASMISLGVAHDGLPRVGDVPSVTNASRLSNGQIQNRKKVGKGLKRIVTGVLSAGPTVKHHHH